MSNSDSRSLSGANTMRDLDDTMKGLVPNEADLQAIEEDVGMASGAWDMVKPTEIIRAAWRRLVATSPRGYVSAPLSRVEPGTPNSGIARSEAPGLVDARGTLEGSAYQTIPPERAAPVSSGTDETSEVSRRLALITARFEGAQHAATDPHIRERAENVLLNDDLPFLLAALRTAQRIDEARQRTIEELADSERAARAALSVSQDRERELNLLAQQALSYALHRHDCSKNERIGKVCTCGLDAIVTRAFAASPRTGETKA